MKNITLTLLIILSSLSTLATTYAPKMLTLDVRNKISAVVSINGHEITRDNVKLVEGEFNYYVSSSCGNRSGKHNLQAHSFMLITCKNNVLNITIQKEIPVNYCYPIYSWFGLPNMQLIGQNCSNHPARNGDTLTLVLREFLDGQWVITYYQVVYSDNGSNFPCTEDRGPGYYYSDNCN